MLPLETRWILSRLSNTAAEVNRSLADYRFDEAASSVYQFFWGDLCDWYLEIIKLRLNFDPTPTGTVILSADPELVEGSESKDPESAEPANDAKELPATNPGPNSDAIASLRAFIHVFESALRLLSPFMPFITEEIWHALYNHAPPAQSVALTRFPQQEDFPNYPSSIGAMFLLQELITGIRSYRKDLGVPEKEQVAAYVVGINQYTILNSADDLITQNELMIQRLARVSSITVCPPSDSKYSGLNWRPIASTDIAIDYARLVDVAAERERLTKDLAKYDKGLAAAQRQLTNETFIAKAPKHIIEGLKGQAEETAGLKRKTEAALAALPLT